MASVNDMEMHLIMTYDIEFINDTKINNISNKIIEEYIEAYKILGE